MSKHSRDKGATFEREIANDLTADWGTPVKRNIGQARDGGDDITVSPFRIECKRRAGIADRCNADLDGLCRGCDIASPCRYWHGNHR